MAVILTRWNRDGLLLPPENIEASDWTCHVSVPLQVLV
jgi:hypothetical protein